MPFGVLPTPAVAYLTVLKGADAGIVISASHNPYEHNGIKVFSYAKRLQAAATRSEANIESLIFQRGRASRRQRTARSDVLRDGLRRLMRRVS